MYVSTAGVGRRSQKNSGTPSRVQDGRLHTDNISVLALNIRSIITYCSHWHKIVIPKLCCGSCTCTWNDSVFFLLYSLYYSFRDVWVRRGIVPTSRRCHITATSTICHAPNSSRSYRVTSSAPMADGLSVWLVRRSGIPCRTACGIRLLAGTVSDNL